MVGLGLMVGTTIFVSSRDPLWMAIGGIIFAVSAAIALSGIVVDYLARKEDQKLQQETN